jgi:hypothetical protein
MTALAFFKNLCASMQDLHPHLRQATLLSAPSIEYKGRAFAMIHDDRIVLKLGEDDLPERMAIGWQYYRPYGRPVYLQQWVEVPFYYRHDWHDLAERALSGLKGSIGED